MTKLYRVVAYVLNLNGDSESREDVKDCLENARHPEFLSVEEILEADCGEWSDDHELNHTDAPYGKYFPELVPGTPDSELIQALRDLRTRNIQLADENKALRFEARELRKEIEGLKRVQEFVKTMGDLLR